MINHSTIRRALLAACPGLLFLIAWQLFADSAPERLFLFGSPMKVLEVARDELPRAEIWWDIFMTLSALLTGLALGTLLGTAVGLLLALHKNVREIMKPTIVFLASIQIFTIAPLLIIWFGIGWGAKVAMATLATGFIALSQVANGVEAAEKRYLVFAQSLKATPLRKLRHITLPGVLHWVLAGFKLNIGFAVLGTLIGEFISSESGLGHYIFKASGIYDVPRVWFGVILLCLIVVGLTTLTERLSRTFTHKEATTTSSGS